MLTIAQMLNHDNLNFSPPPRMPLNSGVQPQHINGARDPKVCTFPAPQHQSPSPPSQFHYRHQPRSAAPSPSSSSSSTSSDTKGRSPNTPSDSESESESNDQQVEFFIGPSRARYTLSRTLAISSSRVLADHFNDPGKSLSRQYSIADTTTEAFELWLEYVKVEPGRCGYRVFPRTIFLDLEKRLKDEKEDEGIEETQAKEGNAGSYMDPDDEIYSDLDTEWGSESDYDPEIEGPTLQRQKKDVLLTLFQLWYLAETLLMPTLQNDVVVQIVRFSHRYQVLPTWDMLDDTDCSKRRGRRPMRRLLVDLWAEMSSEEAGTARVKGKLLKWWKRGLVEYNAARDKMREGNGRPAEMGTGVVLDDYMVPEDERDPEEDA
ncbi:hypothetical protein DL98DRAFT_511264 [Cadophora sp. DSE1049]|nr:hypothetical protein DL98DRAFT_511264 [Cadophora sp. DSE1049]